MKTRTAIVWLQVVSVVTVVLGLVAAAASTSVTDGPWLALFDLLEWPYDGDPSSFDETTRAVNAVLGGVMAGWGTLMYLVISGPVARGSTELINYLMASVVVWFVVDSVGSVVAGLPGNVVLNVSFLALFVPPLLALRGRHEDSATWVVHRVRPNKDRPTKPGDPRR